MQQIEHEEEHLLTTTVEPTRQSFSPLPPKQEEESDDPGQIFVRAVAEIDTQPLPKQRTTALTLSELLEVVLLVSVLCVSLGGVIWQCLTYPHTLVILTAKEYPASITTTLALPTRTLAPVTVTRSTTTPTTGHGHQDARAATGILMFYNGSATPQFVPAGSVFTGNDGVKVMTEQSISVPAANLPAIGSASVPASAMRAGSHGNIAAFDVDVALSSVVKVRNAAPFTNGRDTRDYPTVAPQDLQTLTSTLSTVVAQAFLTAFPLRRGEETIPTQCHTTATPDHPIGREARSVTLTVSKACSAVAYQRDELNREATAAFTHTKPATNYHLVGRLQTSIERVMPVSVTIRGTWVYAFSSDYEQLLAQQIAGDSPAQAHKVLLRTGVISQASIPATLPATMYIDFFVLS